MIRSSRASHATKASYALRISGGRPIEFLLQIVVEAVFEIVGQVLIELVAVLGWRSLSDAIRPERHSHPVLATIGQFLLGLLGGVLSLLIVSRRLVVSPMPGVGLILTPIGTGIAMHALGRTWPKDWDENPWQWWPR